MSSEFERYVVDGLVNYYNKNEYDIIDEYLDDNVIYYGPKMGQTIIGKDTLMTNLRELREKYIFYLSNVSTKMITYSSTQYSIMVNYKLYGKKKINGVDKLYYQRVITNGQRFKDKNGEVFWKCQFICVSNLTSRESAGIEIENETSEKLNRLMSDYEDMQIKNLSLPGDGHTTVYIREDAINFVVGGKGVKCYVHTNEKEYLVRMLLKDIEPLLPSYYYRCHASYIINLRKVLYMTSHEITLSDGTKIPISVKKFRTIQKDINEWMSREQSKEVY